MRISLSRRPPPRAPIIDGSMIVNGTIVAILAPIGLTVIDAVATTVWTTGTRQWAKWKRKRR